MAFTNPPYPASTQMTPADKAALARTAAQRDAAVARANDQGGNLRRLQAAHADLAARVDALEAAITVPSTTTPPEATATAPARLIPVGYKLVRK